MLRRPPGAYQVCFTHVQLYTLRLVCQYNKQFETSSLAAAAISVKRIIVFASGRHRTGPHPTECRDRHTSGWARLTPHVASRCLGSTASTRGLRKRSEVLKKQKMLSMWWLRDKPQVQIIYFSFATTMAALAHDVRPDPFAVLRLVYEHCPGQTLRRVFIYSVCGHLISPYPRSLEHNRCARSSDAASVNFRPKNRSLHPHIRLRRALHGAACGRSSQTIPTCPWVGGVCGLMT